MIHDWTFGDEKTYWPSMDSAIRYLGDKAEVNKKQNPPYSLNSVYTNIDPVIKPAVGVCQIFNGTYSWAKWEAIKDYFLISEKYIDIDYWSAVSYKNILCHITDGLFDKNNVMHLTVNELKEDNDIKMLKIVLKEIDQDKNKAELALYDFDFTSNTPKLKEIGRISIGGKWAYIVTKPVFSESGKKMAFMYTTLKEYSNPSGQKDIIARGQVLHFVEWDGYQFIDRGEESVTIPKYVSGNTREHQWGSQKIKAQWRMMPVYQGESLKYITCHVDNSVDIHLYSDNGSSSASGGYSYFCKLKWPDGKEFICYDIKSNIIKKENSDAFYPTGFVRAIMNIDLITPDDIGYIEYEKNDHIFTNTYASMVWKGEIIKPKIKVKLRDDDEYDHISWLGPGYYPNVCPVYAKYLHTSNIDKMTPFAFPGIIKGGSFINSMDHLAMLMAEPVRVYRGQYAGTDSVGSAFEFGYDGVNPKGSPHCTYIGPILARTQIHNYIGTAPILNEDAEELGTFQYAKYRDEWICYMGFSNPIGFSDGAWTGEDKYYMGSSLDLKAITGIADLSDNILPFGVIQGVDADE